MNEARRTAAFPDSSVRDGIEHWLAQTEERDRLGHALGLNVSLASRVQTFVGLLAPVLAAPRRP